jgi:hypothetical protein
LPDSGLQELAYDHIATSAFVDLTMKLHAADADALQRADLAKASADKAAALRIEVQKSMEDAVANALLNLMQQDDAHVTKANDELSKRVLLAEAGAAAAQTANEQLSKRLQLAEAAAADAETANEQLSKRLQMAEAGAAAAQTAKVQLSKRVLLAGAGATAAQLANNTERLLQLLNSMVTRPQAVAAEK